MSATTSKLQHKTWTKGPYLISTDPLLIPLSALNNMLASKEVYWAKAMPEDALLETLNKSLCFGLYQTDSSPALGGNAAPTDFMKSTNQNFIGIARCITDFVTFVYLTDVFIYPEQQGAGLGRWLVGCVQEVIDSMPYLRRSLLFTSDWERSVPFYEKLMGMEVLESKRSSNGKSGEGVAVLSRNGRGHPDYVEDE